MDLYKILIARINEKLKSRGFSKKGNRFYRKTGDNWGVIDFQKSGKSDPGESEFTINIGICSGKIEEFFGHDDASKPRMDQCHRHKRVGRLLPQNEDVWWKIDKLTNIDALENEIGDAVLNFCIPEIDSHISDESLEKEWQSGTATVVSELMRYIYLTILLKHYGRPNLLEVANELKNYAAGKPFDERAKRHLRELQIENE